MNTTEMLARMWIECDPNRGGTGPDEPIYMDDPQSTLSGKPNWKWFVPRAKATLAYLKKHGYRLTPDLREDEP